MNASSAGCILRLPTSQNTLTNIAVKYQENRRHRIAGLKNTAVDFTRKEITIGSSSIERETLELLSNCFRIGASSRSGERATCKVQDHSQQLAVPVTSCIGSASTTTPLSTWSVIPTWYQSQYSKTASPRSSHPPLYISALGLHTAMPPEVQLMADSNSPYRPSMPRIWDYSSVSNLYSAILQIPKLPLEVKYHILEEALKIVADGLYRCIIEKHADKTCYLESPLSRPLPSRRVTTGRTGNPKNSAPVLVRLPPEPRFIVEVPLGYQVSDQEGLYAIRVRLQILDKNTGCITQPGWEIALAPMGMTKAQHKSLPSSCKLQSTQAEADKDGWSWLRVDGKDCGVLRNLIYGDSLCVYLKVGSIVWGSFYNISCDVQVYGYD